MCKDTQAALWRSPQGEELRLPANIQHQLTNHDNEPLWKCIVRPQTSLQMSSAMANTLTTTSRKALKDPRMTRTKLVPNSWPTDNEIINVYHCFKPLDFRIICYVAIDNQRKNSVLYTHITLILKIQICCMIIFSGILNQYQNWSSWTKWWVVNSAGVYKNQSYLGLAHQYLNLKKTISTSISRKQ